MSDIVGAIIEQRVAILRAEIMDILDEVHKAMQGMANTNTILVRSLDGRLKALEEKLNKPTDPSPPDSGREL